MTLIPELRNDLIDAAAPAPGPDRRRRRVLSRPRTWIATGTVALAAAAAAAVILVSAGSPSRAYALTPGATGTYTLTLYSMTNDIPALNARLAQMGIDETVVPVTDSCTFQFPIYADPGSNDQTTITLYAGRRYLAAGYQGVVAAEQLPDGNIALAMGAMEPADIPSCFATVAHTHLTVIPASGSATTPAADPQTLTNAN